MYGTVAHIRVAPHRLDDYDRRMRTYLPHQGSVSLSRTVTGRHPSGSIAAYSIKLDRDPCQRIVVAIFDSKESYRANAESHEQDADYQLLRADLEADPVWHDGTVEPFAGPFNAAARLPTYGMVSHVRFLPGVGDQLEVLWRNQTLADEEVPGHITSWLFELENDPLAYILVILFASKEDAIASTQDPAQRKRDRALRTLMEQDPDWHRGEVTLLGDLDVKKQAG
jgi:heme-degrading monooxygenase HmoA